jgi:predicted Zn-dependent peptidase
MALSNSLRAHTPRCIFEKAQGETAAVGLTLHYGSAHELPKYYGAAHFIEHLFFSGMEDMTRAQIIEAIERCGATTNAYTQRETTFFYVKAPRAKLLEAARILGRCAARTSFDSREVELERSIILNELRSSEDSPTTKVLDEAAKLALPKRLGHNILGTKTSLRRISCSKLERLFRRYFVAGNILITVAGNIPPRVSSKVPAHFRLPPGKIKHRRMPVPKPKPLTKHFIKDTEQAHLCIAFPVMSARHENIHTFRLIDTILGGGLSSRLIQELREKRGLCYMIGTLLQAEQNYGLFSVYAALKPTKLSLAIKLIVDEFKKLKELPVNRAELAKAKEMLVAQQLFARESPAARAKGLADAELFGWPSFNELTRHIKGLKPTEIIDVAQQYLQHEQYALVVLGPKRLRLNLP